MALVNIEFDAGQMRQLQATLRGIPQALPTIVSRALNKVALAARAQAVRELSKNIGLKQKQVRERIPLARATKAKWLAQLTISAKRIPIIYLDARPAGKNVTYRTGAGWKTLTYDKEKQPLFFQTMRTGHKGVFRRKSKKRYPIAELKGPSLAHVMAAAGYTPDLIAKAKVDLTGEISRQVQVYLQQHARRRSA